MRSALDKIAESLEGDITIEPPACFAPYSPKPAESETWSKRL
jgi:hypothetical protein